MYQILQNWSILHIAYAVLLYFLNIAQTLCSIVILCQYCIEPMESCDIVVIINIPVYV